MSCQACICRADLCSFFINAKISACIKFGARRTCGTQLFCQDLKESQWTFNIKTIAEIMYDNGLQIFAVNSHAVDILGP